MKDAKIILLKWNINEGKLKKRVELQDNPNYEQFILIADVQALTDNFNNPGKERKKVNVEFVD